MEEIYEEPASLERVIQDNEIEANLFLARLLIAFSLALAIFLSIAITIYSSNTALTVCWIGAGCSIAIGAVVVARKGDIKHGTPHILGATFLLGVLANIYIGYNAELAFVVPIILSMRYYKPEVTRRTTVAAIILMFLVCITIAVVGMWTGNIDVNSLDEGLDGVSITIDGTISKTLLQQGLITFADVLRLKLISGVAYAVAIAVVGYVAYYASRAGFRMLQRQVEIDREKHAAELFRERHRADMARLENQISTSQIQPHFLYNALSTISALCTTDPEAARDALEKFSDYLRVNMANMSESRMVPFLKELEHTKTYVVLEQLRFGDDVKVEYDIQCDDFEIPSLSLQPLVENAIKHGICAREDGGTVWVSTRDEGAYVEIDVRDDGVGFDVGVSLDGTHVGLANTRKRLRLMCGGSVRMESKRGRGTTARIFVPRVSGVPAGSRLHEGTSREG